MNEIASAVGDVPQGTERQVRMVESVRELAQTLINTVRTHLQRIFEKTGARRQAARRGR